jgi:DNA helicase-2/ATP-dependent DNA helicase PcrA
MQLIDNPGENAYKTFPGPILLLAGPGTGKTHQLALRTKYLIEELEAQPDEIAVITFTTEAARNMREKLRDPQISLPKEKHPEIISTMHKLGNMIIDSNHEQFGLEKDHGVLPDELRPVLLGDSANIAGFGRAEAKLTDECRRKGRCKADTASSKCRICAEYKNILRKCSCVDYDDQILLACESLRSNAALKKTWQNKAKYLLVDEYQDINQAQCELIQLLADGQSEGLFAVGDDDQSIYSFRGGNPKYIKDFEKFFGKEAKLGPLSVSWRCSEHILKGAKAMLAKFYTESASKPTPTFSEKIEVNNKIVFYDVPTDKYEAWLISKLAREKIESGDEVTIIIPNGKFLPVLKEAFKKSGIDYRYKAKLDDEGLARFTILADWAEGPDDNLKLRYLLDLIINNHDKLTKQLKTTDNKITTKREAASQLIAGLWSEVNNKHSLYTVISEKAKKNKANLYLSYLFSSLEEVESLINENGGTKKALSPFLEKSGLLIAPGNNPRGFTSEIREWINDLFGDKKTSSYKPVSIYNMPSSKGLEADIVFVIGLSEGLFPHPAGNLKEQSRLFFVAMTRAKKELYLFSARTRPASITFMAQSYQLKPSPFINVIPDKHIEICYKKTS